MSKAGKTTALIYPSDKKSKKGVDMFRLWDDYFRLENIRYAISIGILQQTTGCSRCSKE
jgi:hypothetical protein